jgi:hypothetical protein
MTWLGRTIRAPLVHFVLIGSALYLANGMLTQRLREAEPRRIEISASQVEEISQQWWKTTGRTPTAEEFERLVAQRVDEELLLASALALGWERSDPVVQRRLIQNQRFLNPDTEESDAELLELAFEQEMERSDIVVRRRLIERTKLSIASAVRRREPDDSELAAHLHEHGDAFERPPRVRLSQIYLSRDARGEALSDDAARLRRRLDSRVPTAAEALEMSDPSLLPSDLPLWSERMVAARFGPNFARSAMQAQAGHWLGPVPSSYGLHFLFVHEKELAHTPPLEDLRTALRAAVLAEREQEALRGALKALRSDVVVEVAERR